MVGRPRLWDDYLFRDHGLVALDPWRTDLQLLDILVKTDNRSIVRVGSMISLGDERVDEWNSIKATISRQLGRLRAEHGDEQSDTFDYFEKGIHGNIDHCARSSSKLLGGLLGAGYAAAHANIQGDSGHTITVRNISFERVKVDPFTRVACLWRPDKSRPELQQPKKGNWDLWVVTDIRYANRISLRSNGGRADGAAVTVPVPGPVAGPVGMQLMVRRSVGSSWSVTAPSTDGRDSRVPFAFKAVRLRFTADGELDSRRGIIMHVGRRSSLVLRNGDEPLPKDQLLTPNSTDMQELFTTTINEEMELLELLPSTV